ncbi:Transcriptional regulatory protein LiaR [Phaeobacter sp. CECT 5382]|uniref:helix-turn-helix transcriptional regulator n=1 Tax=Phaeobacter sp. CECT 5382 TaxID=1712645 RepID=UPI0006D96EAD|nr:response regulator transcription factor [Phaeobacter sp. CECT 5382]CUH88081.1 Transcriptional regulatory protein LiaR [Phaeobacter sp. CECT 5382]
MNVEYIFTQDPQIGSQKLIGAFFGSPLCFSDTLLKITDGEINNMRFTRLEDISDLEQIRHNASDEQRGSIRNILVDESMLEAFCKDFSGLQKAFPCAQFALAYRQQQNARHLLTLAAEQSELRQISLLPMHLEVDRWLSVLRLLICGEHYVPSELIVPQQQQEAPAPIHEHSRSPDCDVSKGHSANTEAVEPSETVHLTEREIQVLRSAAEGKPNKIIAEELRLSPHTIKLHMHHLMAKLGVHNRTEAAIWFFDHQHEVAGS